MDLIIFSGQSNMQGQTECLPYDNSAVNDAFEYRFADNTLIPLRHPVGENLDTNGHLFRPDFNDIPGTIEKSTLLGAWENHANMVPEFCRSYIAVTGKQVTAVHAAKGSTTPMWAHIAALTWRHNSWRFSPCKGLRIVA